MHALAFIFSLIFLATSTQADGSFSKGEKIKKILQPLNSKAGFSVRDGKGKELFEWHGNEMYPPASVAKLVSSACSLRILSPQYQFPTVFGHTGSIQKGVLNGDLVIVGSGDPSFVVEDLKEILEKLYVVYGIQEIRGSLVFDASYLGVPQLDISEGFQGDQGRSFTAVLTSLPFDFNSFSVWVVPQNGVARIEVQPKEVIEVRIINKVQVTSSGAPDLSLDYRPEEAKAVVFGKLPQSLESKVFYRSLSDPYASLGHVIIRLWKELGGRGIHPKSRIELKPVSFNKLYTHWSHPVSEQFLSINKLSTNFGSELMLLAAGAQQRGKPATFDKSKQVLEDCLKSPEISPAQITLENASGLSRKSTMQPSGLTLFMSRLPKEDFWPEYLSTLSVLGKDGTYRLRLPQFAGQARVKSGSLKGVNTLAGYVFPKKDAPMIFAIFFKCGDCEKTRLTQIENEILTLLLE